MGEHANNEFEEPKLDLSMALNWHMYRVLPPYYFTWSCFLDLLNIESLCVFGAAISSDLDLFGNEFGITESLYKTTAAVAIFQLP